MSSPGVYETGQSSRCNGDTVDDLKRWARAAKRVEHAWSEEERDDVSEELFGEALQWSIAVELVQQIFQDGEIPQDFMNAPLVLVPKQEQEGKYRGIALLKVLYKLVSSVINRRIKPNLFGPDKGL